jgi:hypothetical protein
MWDWVRTLFVTHSWEESSDQRRACNVCGKKQARDTEVEILGPTPWYTVSPGKPHLHFENARAEICATPLAEKKLGTAEVEASA